VNVPESLVKASEGVRDPNALPLANAREAIAELKGESTDSFPAGSGYSSVRALRPRAGLLDLAQGTVGVT